MNIYFIHPNDENSFIKFSLQGIYFDGSKICAIKKEGHLSSTQMTHGLFIY